MTVEIQVPTDDDLQQMVEVDGRNFGRFPPEGTLERAEAQLDLSRFLIAVDGADVVAIAGSFELEVTVPGGATLPMSGVTWVSVLASHTRQGLLRRLMERLDDHAAACGEPLLGLTASEGGIYERFGYGVSTRNRIVELDRRRARIDPLWQPETGTVRLVDPRDHVDELLATFDRYRRTQVGEVSRSEAYVRNEFVRPDGPPPFAALHPDGFALWNVTPQWNNGHPAHELRVEDLVAATDEAHAALWHTILSVDLVGPITSYNAVAHDDALPYLLTDQRALRTVDANDFLWLKVADVVRCFDARSYRVDDRLVVRVVESVADVTTPDRVLGGTGFAIGADGVAPTGAPADLVVTQAALGPLLVGGAAGPLARGRRLSARSAETLERADALFGTGLAPHCRTPF